MDRGELLPMKVWQVRPEGGYVYIQGEDGAKYGFKVRYKCNGQGR